MIISEIAQATYVLVENGWRPERQEDSSVLWCNDTEKQPILEALGQIERQHGLDYWEIYQEMMYPIHLGERWKGSRYDGYCVASGVYGNGRKKEVQ